MPGDNMGRHEQYRKDLAEDLTTIRKQDLEKAQEILDKEKEKREYATADAWQDTVGRPAIQKEIKSEKKEAEQRKAKQFEVQENHEKINKLKELGIEELRVHDEKFLKDVILKGKDFCASLSNVGRMYDKREIGENFAGRLEEFLFNIEVKDYSFLLKLTEKFHDEAKYKISFDITPIRKFSNLGDIKTASASDLIMRDKVIRYSESSKGGNMTAFTGRTYTVETSQGKTFVINQEGDSKMNEQGEVAKEMEKECKSIFA